MGTMLPGKLDHLDTAYPVDQTLYSSMGESEKLNVLLSLQQILSLCTRASLNVFLKNMI